MAGGRLLRDLSAIKHRRLVPEVVLPLVVLDEGRLSPADGPERIRQSAKAWSTIQMELEAALRDGSPRATLVLEQRVWALANEFRAEASEPNYQEWACRILARARELVFAIEEFTDELD